MKDSDSKVFYYQTCIASMYKNRLLFRLLQTLNNWKPFWQFSRDCLYSRVDCLFPAPHPTFHIADMQREPTPPLFPLSCGRSFDGQV
jgi:hypothetical protein